MPKPIHFKIRKDTDMRVKVSYTFLEEAKALAKKQGISLSEMVRRAVQFMLDNEK